MTRNRFCAWSLVASAVLAAGGACSSDERVDDENVSATAGGTGGGPDAGGGSGRGGMGGGSPGDDAGDASPSDAGPPLFCGNTACPPFPDEGFTGSVCCRGSDAGPGAAPGGGGRCGWKVSNYIEIVPMLHTVCHEAGQTGTPAPAPECQGLYTRILDVGGCCLPDGRCGLDLGAYGCIAEEDSLGGESRACTP